MGHSRMSIPILIPTYIRILSLNRILTLTDTHIISTSIPSNPAIILFPPITSITTTNSKITHRRTQAPDQFTQASPLPRHCRYYAHLILFPTLLPPHFIASPYHPHPLRPTARARTAKDKGVAVRAPRNLTPGRKGTGFLEAVNAIGNVTWILTGMGIGIVSGDWKLLATALEIKIGTVGILDGEEAAIWTWNCAITPTLVITTQPSHYATATATAIAIETEVEIETEIETALLLIDTTRPYESQRQLSTHPDSTPVTLGIGNPATRNPPHTHYKTP